MRGLLGAIVVHVLLFLVLGEVSFQQEPTAGGDGLRTHSRLLSSASIWEMNWPARGRQPQDSCHPEGLAQWV